MHKSRRSSKKKNKERTAGVKGVMVYTSALAWIEYRADYKHTIGTSITKEEWQEILIVFKLPKKFKKVKLILFIIKFCFWFMKKKRKVMSESYSLKRAVWINEANLRLERHPSSRATCRKSWAKRLLVIAKWSHLHWTANGRQKQSI